MNRIGNITTAISSSAHTSIANTQPHVTMNSILLVNMACMVNMVRLK